MPLPLIPIIIAAAAALAVVVVTIVYWDDIVKWFRSRNNIKEADRANVAFTIKERLATGEFKLVQGIFNTRTERVVDGHVMQAKQLEARLEREHQGGDLVIYE